MRNRSAPMTGEVHKPFREHWRNWSALPESFSVVARFLACVALFVLTVQGLRAAPQQSASGGNSEGVSGAAVITANPERVTVTDGYGSTDIRWDTRNGSPGFVFVTEDDQKPVVFAKGSQGRRVASWIGRHAYVFELYGDNQRRTLLARVTVCGTPGTLSSHQPKISWQGVGRCVLFLGLMAVSYFAVYLSSCGPLRTTFPTEPTTSPHPVHVARNLVLSVAAFIFLDGMIFHSGLYVSILAPSSYAGRIADITQVEKDRAPSDLKEVLVLGDSRIAEGFSANLANEFGSARGLRFVSLAEPAASANTWYYMVRQVDPTTRRYSAIVIPYGVGYEPNSADPLRISMTAPLLRYGDCFHFASGFQRWSGRFRAFTACILRGCAYQDDVVDLLEHPIARINSLHREAARMHSRELYKGRDYDLVGTSYDSTTGHLTFAEKLTEAQKLAFQKSLIQPSQSDVEYSLKLQRDWIPRIIDRYSKSSTSIVLTPMPRGPFLELSTFSRGYTSVLPSSVIQRATFQIPEHTFEFLEKPEYYFDAFHLNAKGRERFTETLVSQLVGRFQSADSKPDVNIGPQVWNQPPRSNTGNNL